MRIRGIDPQGSGAYRSARGNRLHNGIDICCEEGELITSVGLGTVTKIGYPYNPSDPKRGHLRYVQVTDSNGLDVRYFYVAPSVTVGSMIGKGGVLGRAQGLAGIYKGITEHYHFEVLSMVNGKKVFLDPEQYLKAING